MAVGERTSDGSVDPRPAPSWMGTLFRQLPLPLLVVLAAWLTMDYRIMPADELTLEVKSAWGDFESRYQLAVIREDNPRRGALEPPLQSLLFYYIHKGAHRGCAMRFVSSVVDRASGNLALNVHGQAGAHFHSLLDSDDNVGMAFALSDVLARSGEPDGLMLCARLLSSESFMSRLRARGSFANVPAWPDPFDPGGLQAPRPKAQRVRAASMVILAAEKAGKSPDAELARLDIFLSRTELLEARRLATAFAPEAKPRVWRNSESNAGWGRFWALAWRGLAVAILGFVWIVFIARQLRAIQAVGAPLTVTSRRMAVCALSPMVYLVSFLLVHEVELRASFLMPAHPVAHILSLLLFGLFTWVYLQVAEDKPYQLSDV